MHARSRITRRELLRAAAIMSASLACTVAPSAPGAARGTEARGDASSTAPPTPSPTPAPAGGTLVRAAAFADGRSSASQKSVSLLMRQGRVLYMGPRDGEPDSRGAEIVELPGATVVPGLVDCHVHLSGSGGGLDYVARLQDPDPVLVARGPENARALVRSGVLAARDTGSVRAQNVRIRDDLRGRRDAPLILVAGTWIARRSRYGQFAVQVDDAEGLRLAALAQLDAGADLVKIAVDSSTGSAAHFSASELRPAVDAVHARGKRVAVHAQGLGSRVAAEAGVDTIDHGYVIDADTATRMKDRTALVSTLSVPVGFNNAAELEMGLASVRNARAAGVRIATGTDAGGSPARWGGYALELELLVRAGLQPFEALASATWIAGEVLGVAGVGTLTSGASADLVAVDGDPLSDIGAIRRVRAVFRSGERIA